MELVWPGAEYLPGTSTLFSRAGRRITSDPRKHSKSSRKLPAIRLRFLSDQVDREARGPSITLPDGSAVPRLPGYSQWMWDGEFCGSIGLRWQPGTTELPPYCLGHVGYSVVPWKRRHGYATRALQLLLPQARAEGIAHIELTTDADNVASRRVIETNGGTVVERFRKPAAYGGAESLRFRIFLGEAVPERRL